MKAAMSSGSLLVSTLSLVPLQPVVHRVQSLTGKEAPEQLKESVSAPDVHMALISSFTRTVTIRQI